MCGTLPSVATVVNPLGGSSRRTFLAASSELFLQLEFRIPNKSAKRIVRQHIQILQAIRNFRCQVYQ